MCVVLYCKLVPVYLSTFGKRCPYVSRCFGRLAASPVCVCMEWVFGGVEVAWGGCRGYVSFCVRDEREGVACEVCCVFVGM